MFIPIFAEIFELYVVETDTEFYNLGILYRVVEVQGNKLVQIDQIHIEEV